MIPDIQIRGGFPSDLRRIGPVYSTLVIGDDVYTYEWEPSGMGIADIRDAINNAMLPEGLRCTSCTLAYCDASGSSQGARDHQLLSFTMVNGKDNSTKQMQTKPLPPGADIIAAAITVSKSQWKELQHDKG